jgi:type II secretory ATPase GspE/PulE/Tfp pilus assembly ATPase PilB-like protein
MLIAVFYSAVFSVFLPSVPSVPLWFVLFGEQSFPRGPGFYFDSIKLGLTVVIYLLWIRTCWWADVDARRLALGRKAWNPLMLGCGLLGLFVVWLLPWFWVSLFILLLLYLTPTLLYVNFRNEKAPEDAKVLTGRHLRLLGSRYLGMKPPPRKQKDERMQIQFIGKSQDEDEEDPHHAHLVQSKGYKGALMMVYDAIEMRATDIHMEPTREEMTVRFRIDGMLQPAPGFGRHNGDAVVNIFKVLADLDITEKRKPQDGSFSARVEGRKVDFRVATSGSVSGEKLVMRILDTSRHVLSLAQLGMRSPMRRQLHELVTQPHGMLVVCGPTGAGKSTTLYACLNEIDRYQMNVITLENPVEYNIENVTQIEVNEKTGKTFAGELRSILRQDPDVIYLGEIRDGETAEVACQAAQTGHMVLTTLHANDTVSALARLIDLGVKPFMIGSALSGVLGQRLVRILCPRCKVRYKPNPDMLHKANLPVDKIKYFYRPPDPPPEPEEGEEPEVCEHCGGNGYRGRTGVFEMLVITDRIRDLIRDNPNMNAIKQEAVRGGLKFLQEEGLRLVIEGTTSIQEVLRVCK